MFSKNVRDLLGLVAELARARTSQSRHPPSIGVLPFRAMTTLSARRRGPMIALFLASSALG
jgi:hypothetical protein